MASGGLDGAVVRAAVVGVVSGVVYGSAVVQQWLAQQCVCVRGNSQAEYSTIDWRVTRVPSQRTICRCSRSWRRRRRGYRRRLPKG